MDRINFQGRTTLVTSPETYAIRRQTISNDNLNFRNYNHIKPGVTKECNVNDGDIFVLVHNGTEGSLRRIGYDIQLGAKTLIDSVLEDLQNFGKDLKENITCVIMGGRSKDSVTTKCVNDIADKVEYYLANNNKKGDLSIICGITDELKAPILIDCKKNSKVPEIYIPAEIESPVSAEQLEDVFDIVELSNMELKG